MDAISAFAAYNVPSENKTTKVKKDKPKEKKGTQKENTEKTKNIRPQFMVPSTTAAKKRQRSTSHGPSEAGPSAKSKKKDSNATPVNNKVVKPDKVKTNKVTKPKTPVPTNAVPVNPSHALPSPSTSSGNELNLSSLELGRDAFAHLISGTERKDFMSKIWEKKPIYIGRDNRGHYDHLKVSTEAIDMMLRNNVIEFTKNLDVTSYENGVRETHNPDGRALPGSVWGFYRDGCSIRLINPQTFMPSLNKFNAKLQEYFHCLVGANIYLTPPNSQGFAPHYDDIEAFVLQMETLPRESSGNFSQDEIGDPVFTQILKPGDLLYFPRGWIHQARTVENSHSLHVTLSVYQKTSFADILEELTKQALKKAIESDLSIRKGLPMHIWNQFGQTYAGYDGSLHRNEIKGVITKLFRSLENSLDIDGAVDKLALKYQHDALPPVLSSSEKVRTTFGTKPIIHQNGEIAMPEMNGNTHVRLIRAQIVRLIYEDGAHLLYYYADNSKEYHGSDMNFIELEEQTVDAIKKLIQLYPKYTKIQDLSENSEEAMAVAYSLWDRGLLMTKSPLH